MSSHVDTNYYYRTAFRHTLPFYRVYFLPPLIYRGYNLLTAYPQTAFLQCSHLDAEGSSQITLSTQMCMYFFLILGDRGFTCDDLFSQHGARLVTPDFLDKDDGKLTRVAGLRTRILACARGPIERWVFKLLTYPAI